MEELVEIGYFSRTHGVRGELVVKLINPLSQSIQKGVVIYIKSIPSIEKEVLSSKYGNNLIISLAGINNMDDAKKLVGEKTYLLKSSLSKKLNEDEYLLNDLLGFHVMNERKLCLGTINGFSSNGVQDIASIKTEGGKFIDLLLIKPILKNIDFDNRVVFVNFETEFF